MSDIKDYADKMTSFLASKLMGGPEKLLAQINRQKTGDTITLAPRKPLQTEVFFLSDKDKPKEEHIMGRPAFIYAEDNHVKMWPQPDGAYRLLIERIEK